ncbi:hypothetical protein NPX13_g8460 [Xylaria arbuscula]|uniref:Uncharacterized protein n=1 Tax=Xylaria arbuscula TaxID=114810 RepID=A0A9W8N8P7_9PEZI|nr:hypothetical protein NPX13_g8460 [Xylaria arbuscula]
MAQQPISLEITVNIVLGIISWVIAVAGVIATVRCGRQQRHRQNNLRDQENALPNTERRGQAAVRQLRFAAFEYLLNDVDDGMFSPLTTRDVLVQPRQ